MYGLIGVGVSVSYRTTGVINLAQGELVALGAYLAYAFWSAGLPLPLAIGVSAVAVGLFMGVLERVAWRPLYRRGTVYPIVSSIGLSVAIQAAISLIWGPAPLVLPSLVSKTPLELWGLRITMAQLAALVIAVLLCVFTVWLLNRTKVGRGMRTLARDQEVASLFGINASRLFFVAFALSGVLAGAAGGLIGPEQGLNPTMGLSLGLAGFSAAVVGGLGSAQGALVGGMLIGVVGNLAVLYITPSYKDAVAYALLILVLIARPQGLLGEVTAKLRRV
ncbi:MAG: inner-rane translocator [Dactylosporangium sp.]|nr:inner-rane translocator [Dactylosporangium sp.]